MGLFALSMILYKVSVGFKSRLFICQKTTHCDLMRTSNSIGGLKLEKQISAVFVLLPIA